MTVGSENPATINGVAYPVAEDRDGLLWRIADNARLRERPAEDWLQMGETRRETGRGYYFSQGFDATRRNCLRLSPFYHADNIIHLSTGYGYFFEVAGPVQTVAFVDGRPETDHRTTGTSAQVVTLSNYVIASGDNRLLRVGVSMGSTGSSPVVSVTYGGVNLTRLTAQSATGGRVEIWYLVAPEVGTADIVVTFLGTPNSVVGASNVTGANQQTPFGDVVMANGTGTAVSVVVASETNELVFDVIAANINTSGTPGGGQTEVWDTSVSTTATGISSREAGAASVTMSYTLAASATWLTLGVPINRATNVFVYCIDADKILKHTYDSTQGITEVVAVSGTADSATASTLVDAAPAWTDDQFNDNLIEITGGTGAGQRRRITDTIDATDTINIAPNWDTTPDATSTYRIYGSVHVASGVGGRPVYANSKWYVPMGASVNVRRLDTVGATTDTWADAGFTGLAKSTFQQGINAAFARAHTTNQVDLSLDTGNLASFGDDFPIGDGSTTINDLREAEGELFVGKEDNLYQMDQEGTSKPRFMFRGRGNADADNGKGMAVLPGIVYYPADWGLGRYRINEAGIGVGIDKIRGFYDVPNISAPVDRRHAFVENAGEFLYLLFNDAENSTLTQGRFRDERAGDPFGPEMVWNMVLEIPLSKGLFVDSQMRLWIKGASVAEADRDIRVIELANNGSTDVPNRRGQASADHDIWLDEVDFGIPFDDGQMAHIVIETENWNVNASLQIRVYRDGGTVENLGAAITTSGRFERAWTVGTNDGGRRLRVRLTVTTNGSYTPLNSDPCVLRINRVARSPQIYRVVVPADDEALQEFELTAVDAHRNLTRLLDSGQIAIGDPGRADGDATYNAEVVRVTDVRYELGDGSIGYGIEVFFRRFIVE